MPQYIAFLRAINVGGHTVKMDHLRHLFAELGFSQVETFIASGNVIFQADSANTAALEQQIASHLAERLGYPVATFIRTPAEVATITHYKLFPEEELNEEGNMLYIGFLAQRPADDAVARLLSFNNEVDEFHIHGRELYWLARKKISESQFSGARLEKTLGMPMTLRNSTTVKKLAAKYKS